MSRPWRTTPAAASGSSSPAPSTCSTSCRSSAIMSAARVGLDEDAVHWVGVAVRESVINAIKHGNQNDAAQARVRRVRDRVVGRGAELLDPRARSGRRASIPRRWPTRSRPRTCSRRSGRGIFLIRSFMDDVRLQRAPRGRHGNPHDQARAAARPPAPSSPEPVCHTIPLLSTTAVEAVVRAGDMMMARFGQRHPRRQEGRDRSRHRGRPGDRARCSARSSPSAFPITRCSARSWAAARPCPQGPCWVFDPIDGTTNFAHGLPIFCSSLALEIDGVAEVARRLRSDAAGAVHGRARRRRVPERAAAPRVGGRRRSSTRCSSPGFPYDVHSAGRRDRRPVRRVRRPGARRPPAGVGGDRPLLRRGRPHGRLLGERPQALGHRRRRADRRRGRRDASPTWTAAPFASRGRQVLASERSASTTPMLDVIRERAATGLSSGRLE